MIFRQAQVGEFQTYSSPPTLLPVTSTDKEYTEEQRYSNRNLVWRARNSQETNELLVFLFWVEFQKKKNKPLPKCTELSKHTEKKIFNFAFLSSPNFWGVLLRKCSEDRNCIKDSGRSQDEGQKYPTCYLLQWECSSQPPPHPLQGSCAWNLVPVWACWECLGLWEVEPNRR